MKSSSLSVSRTLVGANASEVFVLDRKVGHMESGGLNLFKSFNCSILRVMSRNADDGNRGQRKIRPATSLREYARTKEELSEVSLFLLRHHGEGVDLESVTESNGCRHLTDRKDVSAEVNRELEDEGRCQNVDAARSCTKPTKG